MKNLIFIFTLLIAASSFASEAEILNGVHCGPSNRFDGSRVCYLYVDNVPVRVALEERELVMDENGSEFLEFLSTNRCPCPGCHICK